LFSFISGFPGECLSSALGDKAKSRVDLGFDQVDAEAVQSVLLLDFGQKTY